MNDSDSQPIALVTGGCAGLGLVITRTLISHGYQVIALDRNESQMQEVAAELGDRVTVRKCDVTVEAEVAAMFGDLDRLDVLVNCVGVSDRGLLEKLSLERLNQLLPLNVHCTPALLAAGAAVAQTIGWCDRQYRLVGGQSRSAIHRSLCDLQTWVAALTQQLRLELKPSGVHVGLVSPGPIRREDAGQRYQEIIGDDLPEQAAKPGGGTKVKGLPPQRVADAVVRCIDKRLPDILLPGYLRLLLCFGHAFPRLGDWLLLKFTS